MGNLTHFRSPPAGADGADEPRRPGGLAVADASGGDDNVAGALGGAANAGNGGTANASANGGTIAVGDVNSGGNTGNVISVGN